MEIGAPDVSDDQLSLTTLVLEESTPWVNKAELCVTLPKEAVCVDVCEADSPISLLRLLCREESLH